MLGKKDFYYIFILSLGFWLLTSALQLPIGIMFADHRECTEPKSRIEYVFPAFRLGCWLGEVPGAKK